MVERKFPLGVCAMTYMLMASDRKVWKSKTITYTLPHGYSVNLTKELLFGSREIRNAKISNILYSVIVNNGINFTFTATNNKKVDIKLPTFCSYGYRNELYGDDPNNSGSWFIATIHYFEIQNSRYDYRVGYSTRSITLTIAYEELE